MWCHLVFVNVTLTCLQVDAHAGMLHDALLMWAYGVNKTLQQGAAANDGINVTRNIFNLTFEGTFLNIFL